MSHVPLLAKGVTKSHTCNVSTEVGVQVKLTFVTYEARAVGRRCSRTNCMSSFMIYSSDATSKAPQYSVCTGAVRREKASDGTTMAK